MAGASTTLETIVQLNSARGLALNDANFYKQIVPGVLPIVGISAAIELQRWGADFIAESLASAALANEEKQQLSLLTLQIIKDYLESPRNDETVVKSAIQAATSAYPLAFRHVYVYIFILHCKCGSDAALGSSPNTLRCLPCVLIK